MFPGVAFRTVLDSICLNTSMSLKSTRDLEPWIKKRSSVWPYEDVTASNELYVHCLRLSLKLFETSFPSNSILISKHSYHPSLEWVALLCSQVLALQSPITQNVIMQTWFKTKIEPFLSNITAANVIYNTLLVRIKNKYLAVEWYDISMTYQFACHVP